MIESNELREALATYAHEAWSGWMKYMFQNGGQQMLVNTEGESFTCWVMVPRSFDRWQRQMNTPYESLPESEKASDRDEADKMLAILEAVLTQDARAAEALPLFVAAE